MASGHKSSDPKTYAHGEWEASGGGKKGGMAGLPRCGKCFPHAQEPSDPRTTPTCACRVWRGWCSTTGACSTRSSSSWMGGDGADPGTASWTSVSGEGRGPFGATLWLGSPCGWGGWSLAPRSPPCVCRCAAVRGADRTAGAALTAQRSGVSLGPGQEDLPLPAGESEPAVQWRWQQPRWERTGSFGEGERTRRNHFQKTP